MTRHAPKARDLIAEANAQSLWACVRRYPDNQVSTVHYMKRQHAATLVRYENEIHGNEAVIARVRYEPITTPKKKKAKRS